MSTGVNTSAMEDFSIAFLSSIVTAEGYFFEQPKKDSGVDIKIESLYERSDNGKKRRHTTGIQIDIQLKSNLENSEKFKRMPNGDIKYTLEVKNYNDLISRKNAINSGARAAPLILVVVILPEINDPMIEVCSDHLKLYKEAFWYYPDVNEQLSNNSTSQSITIPNINKVSTTFASSIFQKFP